MGQFTVQMGRSCVTARGDRPGVPGRKSAQPLPFSVARVTEAATAEPREALGPALSEVPVRLPPSQRNTAHAGVALCPPSPRKTPSRFTSVLE